MNEKELPTAWRTFLCGFDLAQASDHPLESFSKNIIEIFIINSSFNFYSVSIIESYEALSQ